jgi:hypothetical protein
MNTRINLTENRLKSIIRESINKVLKEEVWGNPQSQERQLGDEYLRMTMDFCKNNGIYLNGSIINTQLIPKLREVISIMLNASKNNEPQKGNGKMMIPLTGKRD